MSEDDTLYIVYSCIVVFLKRHFNFVGFFFVVKSQKFV